MASHHNLLFITLLTSLFLDATTACHVDDESGLLAFKSGITRDPTGILSSWKPGTDCCGWSGVQCRSDGRVTMLSFRGESDVKTTLSGTISPSLSKLRFLDTILFQYLGGLSGPFPHFLFDLPDIQTVYFVGCKLSGKIPENIGELARLSSLSLEGNRFSGSIPSSIGNLSQLTELRLDGNRLTGGIPEAITHLKKLNTLSLMNNKLSGSIPDYLAALPELTTLRLSHNKFSGEIPSSISALSPKLQFLELGHNKLRGKIPDFIGNFHAIETLDLSWNHFSGAVPKSFLNLTALFVLDLSHNSLVDPFPTMNVERAQTLDLSYNKFHLGEIPDFVTASPNMFSLRLAKCGVKIKLDDWKPKEYLFYLYIDLSENEITGSPVGLFNRTENLRGFYASGNKLEFNLEDLRFNVKELKELDLSRNRVFGKVPETVAVLQKLNLSHNRLCGRLPATKFPAAVFAGNACLCGSPLPPCKA
nr:DNA-damage-repair/toleration protein DRT100-like [Ipomoea trifida]